jgi:AcrR family transcriptional regulator
MKRKIRQERKSEIIEGFYQLAKEVGMENASIAKIGKHLNMPPSLIMHYFPNKDMLIADLIRYILEHYQLIYQPVLEHLHLSHTLDVHALVERLFSREWNLLFDDGVFYSCYAMTFRNPAIRAAYKDLHLALRKTLDDILRQDKQHAQKDTRRLAEQIYVVVEGAYYYLGMIDDEAEYQEKLHYFKKQVLDLLLNSGDADILD